jgi:hypothetical protein
MISTISTTNYDISKIITDTQENLINYYPLTNNFEDKINSNNGTLRSDATGVSEKVVINNRVAKFPGNVLFVNSLSGSNSISFGKTTTYQQVAQMFLLELLVFQV